MQHFAYPNCGTSQREDRTRCAAGGLTSSAIRLYLIKGTSMSVQTMLQERATLRACTRCRCCRAYALMAPRASSLLGAGPDDGKMPNA